MARTISRALGFKSFLELKVSSPKTSYQNDVVITLTARWANLFQQLKLFKNDSIL